ncbi:MAG: anthranilate synthase component I [Deltaproteobacteria bacterium]|nr:anthranilate synthase component I [Deltaproteobacteria bacterium]
MKTQPSQEVFLAQAGPGSVIPVWQEFHADLETPVSAYLKIAARYPDDHFLLESVEGGEKWARYSFIGFDPYIRFRIDRNTVTITRGGKSEIRTAAGDPMKELEGILSGIRYVQAEGLPRLSGGAAGFIGYDYVRNIEKIPDTHPDEGTPDALFLFPSRLVIFDNVKHTIRIVVHGQGGGSRPESEEYRRCVQAIGEVKEVLQGPLRWTDIPEEAGDAAPPAFEVPREVFLAAVRKAKEYIREGEIIQAVLSNRSRVRTRRSPSEVYRVLRSQNPSPYMFLLKFGDLALVGSSPEILVRLEGDLVQLRPIAGTRPRGTTAEEDRRMEAELLSDPKELAEHVMLVDLGRNDVGRVSEWGTVKVDEQMVVERYSHVMHIVSNVIGILRKEMTAFDVLRAAFPAGTVTGAPKVRAMEIIEELEPFRRGIYAGSVGYFDLQGSMDFCITIRTIVMRGDEALIQAGAGIVADSDPDKEWEEIHSKARILFRAAGASDQAEKNR